MPRFRSISSAVRQLVKSAFRFGHRRYGLVVTEELGVSAPGTAIEKAGGGQVHVFVGHTAGDGLL